MRARRAGRLALPIAAALLLAACATGRDGPERPSFDGLPTAATLDGVPFHPQTDFHCGPAALASILNFGGVDTSPEALIERVYLPGRQGSLQAEMLAASRALGRVAYRLPPTADAILAEVAAGRPVLVLENLGLVRRPIWHYAVVIGYSAEQALIVQHSGGERAQASSLRRWLLRWRRAGRWAMVALSPGELPVADDPAGWISALADFEATAGAASAEPAWAASVERWPDQALAWFGLGNGRAARGDWPGAEAAFLSAHQRAPEHAPTRYNLARLALRRDAPCEAASWLKELLDHPALGERAERDLAEAFRACQPAALIKLSYGNRQFKVQVGYGSPSS